MDTLRFRWLYRGGKLGFRLEGCVWYLVIGITCVDTPRQRCVCRVNSGSILGGGSVALWVLRSP